MKWTPGGKPLPLATSPVVSCPRCGSTGATAQSVIVTPRLDGTDEPCGRVYGCPHCSVLYGVQAGLVYLLGHKRRESEPPSPEDRVARETQIEARRVRTDGDMPWARW